MKEVLQGIAHNPVEEIYAKVQQYFRSHGLMKEGYFDKVSPCEGDFAIDIYGTIDDIQVQVVYQDYKPKKIVMREIMALDDRICNVDVYRSISDEHYKEELDRITLETIYVMVDGKLMETTLYDYVLYGTRNIDYSRR